MPELQGGSPSLLWSINARAVLEAIDAGGLLARPEITRLTGLSKTTIAQTLGELVQRGIVLNAGLDESRRGPAATLYTLNSGFSLGVAADVGHHRTRVAIIDASGTMLAKREAPSARGVESATVATVLTLIDECREELGLHLGALDHAVIGVPGVVSPQDGSLRLSPGLPDSGRTLPERLRAALPMPVTLENDTNLAALAEYRDGEGAGTSSFAYLSMGVGIGAGIVLEGRLHRGFGGAAGEVAYLPAPGDPPAEIIGARSVAKDAIASGITEKLSPQAIFDRARRGDAQALEVVDLTARRLSNVIASIALVLDPEVVILGGAIGAGGADLLLEPVRHHLAQRQPLARARVLGTAIGEDAVLRGASTRVWQLIREAAFSQAAGPTSASIQRGHSR